MKNFTFLKRFICRTSHKENREAYKINELIKFCNDEHFYEKFFILIYKARIKNNLNDYFDLNKRYLNLTSIFEFNADFVEINTMFKIILEHSNYKNILEKISKNKISISLLSEYFDDDEFKNICKQYNIIDLKNIPEYTKNEQRKKLQNLINTKFSKEQIIEILGFFKDRKNDEKIKNIVSKEATVLTIFKYIIAIAWHYIDNKNIERIFEAKLSLDINLLPKSHAVGGTADLIYFYENPPHALMIEATLSEKTNQRRSEMESVSRHLGNLLLSLEHEKQKNTFAIFIAPYLDKNVLNDFRSRINCYFENEKDFINGMKIIPLSTDDLIVILRYNISYDDFYEKCKIILNSKNYFGSRWYENEIKDTFNDLPHDL